jgi:hypothetical protein
LELKVLWAALGRRRGFVLLAIACTVGATFLVATKFATPLESTKVGPTTGANTAACSGAPNTLGGPDPWGGCWPGPNNTGVPAGTTLTAYTGPTTITVDGSVIDSKLVTGCIVIEANNVTIKNSRLQSNGCYFNILDNNGNTGLKLTDVEIDGQTNTTSDSSIGGDNYTCLRCNIHGTTDGAKAGDNVVFRDSYIHDLAITSTSHNDSIQSLGTNSLQIIHNTLISKSGSNSAIILSTGSASRMRNVLMQRNLAGGGGYTIYGGYGAGTDDLSRVSNVSITENRISTAVYPRGGAFGAVTSVDPPAVSHSGNVWADGPNAGKSVD